MSQNSLPFDLNFPKWFVLSVRANQEKKTAQRLASYEIEHLLPCYLSLRQWKDRRVTLEMPLFPGYVFVHLPFVERVKVLSLPNVVGLIGSKNAPSVVSEDEIDSIRRGVEFGNAAPHGALVEGQHVVITDGVLRGMQGTLLRSQNNTRVVVAIDSIARFTAMRSQLDQPMTLQQMARIGYASPYHFNRTFRQITGVPPSQFLYALRLDAAKRMLTETQKKVIDICYEVGYRSVGTFTRRFADVLGVSPVRFRKLTDSRARQLPYLQMDGSTGNNAMAGASLTGTITAPRHFRGVVAVGLFTTRIPQGKPVSCSLIKDGGIYHLEGAPEGEFYLFAVGLKDPADASVYFDWDCHAGGRPARSHHAQLYSRSHFLAVEAAIAFRSAIAAYASCANVCEHIQLRQTKDRRGANADQLHPVDFQRATQILDRHRWLSPPSAPQLRQAPTCNSNAADLRGGGAPHAPNLIYMASLPPRAAMRQ